MQKIALFIGLAILSLSATPAEAAKKGRLINCPKIIGYLDLTSSRVIPSLILELGKWREVKQTEKLELAHCVASLIYNGAVATTSNFQPDKRVNVFALKEDSPLIKEAKSLAEKGSVAAVSTVRGIKNPEGWKRAEIPDQVRATATKLYLEKFPVKEICKKEEPDSEFFALEDTEEKLQASDLRILKRAFKNKNSDYLVGVIQKVLKECKTDPHEIDSYFHVQWAFVRNKSKSFLISCESCGSSMIPLEAVDFDGDGKSEWLFYSWSFDKGFYGLFLNNFNDEISGRLTHLMSSEAEAKLLE